MTNEEKFKELESKKNSLASQIAKQETLLEEREKEFKRILEDLKTAGVDLKNIKGWVDQREVDLNKKYTQLFEITGQLDAQFLELENASQSK